MTNPDSHPTRHLATSVAATVYVAAWLVGLAVLPSGPDAAGSAGTIRSALAAHAGAAVLQSWLVHGVAAVALVCFVRSALRLLGCRCGGPALHRLTLWSVQAAAAASLVQVAFLHLAVATATRSAASTGDAAAAWFHAVNVTDVVKLALLGLVVAGLTRGLAAAGAPAWFTWPATGLAVALPVAGLAFVTTAPLLGGMLAPSLVLLLVWAGVAAVLVARRTRRGAAPSGTTERKTTWA